MSDLFQAAYDQLFSWCQQRDFAGHDPFDALNSRLFQATPLAQSRNARFIWTQVVKRSPADPRALIRVRPDFADRRTSLLDARPAQFQAASQGVFL